MTAQDLTVTIMSERLEREVELEDDHRQPSTINVESFVDEQEWRLYHEVETFQGVVNKFYEGIASRRRSTWNHSSTSKSGDSTTRSRRFREW